MGTIFTEDLRRPAHFLVSEAEGFASRQHGIIAAGSGVLPAGTVLGRITATGKFKPFDPSASDGTQTARAILFEGCDATAADARRTIIKRRAEVMLDLLQWKAGITADQKVSAYISLADFRIGVRGTVIQGGGPIILMDFANALYSGASLSDLTVSRNSPKNVVWADGSITTLAANQPAISDLGLLIEPSAQNLLLHSNNLMDAVWSKTDTMVGTAVLSNGWAGWNVVENSAGTAGLSQAANGLTANQSHCFSLLLERGNHDWVRVVIDNGSAANRVQTWFNTSTGLFGAIQATGSVQLGRSAVKLGSATYRVRLSFTGNTVATGVACRTYSAIADADETRVSNGWRLQGAHQLEVVTSAVTRPSSYIATTTARVTRAADDITMTGPLKAAFEHAEGCVVASLGAVTTGAALSVFGVDSAADGLGITSGLLPTQSAGGATQTATNTLDFRPADTYIGAAAEMAIGWDASGRSLTTAVEQISDATPWAPTIEKLGIRTDGAAALRGYLRKLQFWRSRDDAGVFTRLAKRRPFAAWGDSLTEGLGTNGFGRSYPRQLDEMRGLCGHYNGGVSGNTSTQIAARMTANTTRRDWIVAIGAGRNDLGSPATIKTNIASMVATLGTSDYVILAIINQDASNEWSGTTAYNSIVSLNNDFNTIYPDNFLNDWEAMKAIYDPDNATHVADHAKGLIVSDLRADQLHLNELGYRVKAKLVYNFGLSKGWWANRPAFDLSSWAAAISAP